ncbi:hypothetical protein [Pseudomonas soli]|uniref:hypothetical protein n=1 Tax=Pseudomonas soli TaxID=1306993 RepID=UPI003DA8546A
MQAAKELDQVTNVSFLFGIAKVQAEAPPDYARKHLLRYLAEYGEQGVDEERLQQMTRLMAAIPLTSADTLPTLRDSVLRQHAARTACIRQAVERQTPLLEGETLLEESFAFLGKPYNGCRVRSVALLRTTNYGQLVYLFKDVVVGQDGQLLFIEAVGPVSSPAADLELSSTDVVAAAFGELGGKLATSLASAVGGAIGKALFEQAFPPGVPSYFDQVYVELKRIVGGELQQSLIDSIDGSIKSIQQHLETEYLPAKESLDLTLLEDRKQLFALLQKYETTYLSGPGGMLGTLMNERYAKLGFGVFLIAAGVQLALFQEMAFVDPNGLGRDGTLRSPLQSSYGQPKTGTVARAAKMYAEFAAELWPRIIKDREAKISHDVRNMCAPGDTGGTSCHRYGWLDDELERSVLLPCTWKTKVTLYRVCDGDKSGKNPNLDFMNERFANYPVERVEALRKSLGVPETIIEQWRSLIETPVRPAPEPARQA